MANLMNYIRHNDECTISIASYNDTGVAIPVIKGAWIGPKTEVPIKLHNNKDMAKWLVNRNLGGQPVTEASFKQWVTGKCKDKDYFPFISEIHEATVVAITKDMDKGRIESYHLTKLDNEAFLFMCVLTYGADSIEKTHRLV